MVTPTTLPSAQGERDLLGQTLVVIGGSAGIGFETARLAHEEGAAVIITARNPDRLHNAGLELGASIAAFDATDFDRLKRFFDELPTPIDHVLVTGPGPYYAPLAELDIEEVRRNVDAHLMLPLQVARNAAGKVRPGGTLLFMGGTGGRRTAPGVSVISALSAALPALTKNLALELAPIRVNLIAAGFVDTPLSATLLGDQLDARREQLRTTLPGTSLVALQWTLTGYLLTAAALLLVPEHSRMLVTIFSIWAPPRASGRPWSAWRRTRVDAQHSAGSPDSGRPSSARPRGARSLSVPRRRAYRSAVRAWPSSRRRDG